MIGILYPRALIGRLMRGGRSFEKPSLYVAEARRLGEEMFFFSLADIDWRSGTARGQRNCRLKGGGRSSGSISMARSSARARSGGG